MKQLLIVNSAKALNAGATSPNDLSTLQAGAISFFELGASAFLSAAPTKNFAIALGRPNNSPAFLIPEVDVNTLQVTVANNAVGATFVGSVTIPTVVPGNTYTLTLVKLGVGINGERNKWTKTVTIKKNDSTTDAAAVAKELRDGFQAVADTGAIDITVSGTGATVTLTGKNKGEGWALVAGDDLYGTTVTTTNAEAVIGDKAFIQKLAQECAGNKGFLYTDPESQHIYPGYPETVEDTTYKVFTLRFATGRAAGKQTDERIWQTVHIAVPTGSAALATITTILTQPVLPNAASNE